MNSTGVKIWMFVYRRVEFHVFTAPKTSDNAGFVERLILKVSALSFWHAVGSTRDSGIQQAPQVVNIR